jgi:putative flippase GtrA
VQFVRFCLVGASVFLAEGVMLMALVHGIGLSPELARCITFPLAVSLAWYLNRRFTFRSLSTARLRELRNYALTNTFGLAANLAAYYSLLAFLPVFSFYELLALAAGSVAGLTLNFLMAKWWVFHRAG